MRLRRFLAVGTIVLTACGGSSGGAESTTTSAATTMTPTIEVPATPAPATVSIAPGATASTTAAPAAVPVAAGTWVDVECPAVAAVEAPAVVRCGTVTVPEHHADPGARQVKLPVAIVAHPGASANPPVVYLDGGPGGDSLGLAAVLAAMPLATDRLVVLVGQRGSRLAEPSFDCPEVEDVHIDQLDMALDQSTADASSAATRACFERVAAQGVAFDAYDTVSAADDVEAVRLTLGYDQWDLYGVSYGTRLALEVMRRHPDRVRSVVLDSAYPPDVESYATLVPGAERAFDEIVTACGEDPTCAPVAPTMNDRVVALYDHLELEPYDAVTTDPETGAPVTVRWDGSRLAQALFTAMYSSAVIPLLPALLASIEAGDFGLATSYYLEYIRRNLSGSAEGLYLAVECRERAPFSDPAELERVNAAAEQWLVDAATAETTIGDCTQFEMPPLAAPAEAVHSALPTLVLAGRFDPITPPDWGRQAAATLPNSTLVLLPTGGHAVSFTSCGSLVVASFLTDPTAAPDTTCTNDTTIAWSIP